MAKDKPKLEVGDVVYHKNSEDKLSGTVVGVKLVEVDWGPETGSLVHHEDTLTDKFTPKFGE